MRLRQMRLALRSLILGLVLATGVTAASGFLWPTQVEVAPVTGLTQAAGSPSQTTATSLPDVQEFEILSETPFRRPLFDPPPPEPETRAVRTPVPRIELLGTIVEPGRSLALIKGPTGQTDLKAEGDVVAAPGGGLTVVRVDRHEVLMRYVDEELVVRLPEPVR